MTQDLLEEEATQPPVDYLERHMRFGWWALLVFLSLGAVLEGMLAFKVQWYVNVANDTRHLLLTLGHAHGTLLAVVNIVYALSVPRSPATVSNLRGVASASFLGSALLLPAGFLLGGVWAVDGDPGVAIVLVPLGAALLFAAVLLTALEWTRR